MTEFLCFLCDDKKPRTWTIKSLRYIVNLKLCKRHQNEVESKLREADSERQHTADREPGEEG